MRMRRALGGEATLGKTLDSPNNDHPVIKLSTGQRSSNSPTTARGDSNTQSTNPRRNRRRYRDFEADLKAKLESVKASVTAAATENQQLKDLETALLNLDDQAAYIGSILSRADLSCCFLPSASIGPHPVQATINLVIESAWGGKQPPDEWMVAYAKVQPDFIIKSDVEFITRLHGTVILWSTADTTTRNHLESRMRTAIQARSRIMTVMARSSPLFMMDLWKKLLPPAPTTPEGKRVLDELVRLVAGIYLTVQQREAIRAAWGQYRSSMNIIEGQIMSAQQALAGLQQTGSNGHFGEGVQERTAATDEPINESARKDEEEMINGLHAQSHTHVAAADCMRAVKDAQIRAVFAFETLSSLVCSALNWTQFVHLQFGMRNAGAHLVDTVQLCQVVEADSFIT